MTDVIKSSIVRWAGDPGLSRWVLNTSIIRGRQRELLHTAGKESNEKRKQRALKTLALKTGG